MNEFAGTLFPTPELAAKAAISQWATAGGLNGHKTAIEFLRDEVDSTIDEMMESWEITDETFGISRDELIALAAGVAADLERELQEEDDEG